MSDLFIRKATLVDINQIQEIGKTTFAETFLENNSVENMNSYLEKSFNLEKLTTEITNPNSQFYLALLKDETIGYLKVNFGLAQTEIKDSKALEIERIYILKAYYGKKIGQQLFEKAIEIAQKEDFDYLWLGVWEENPRAIQFYTKNGFSVFDKHIFKIGDDKQTDFLMKKMLKV